MKFIASFIASVFVFLMLLCLITPDKTKYGIYTEPVKYWTDNEYFKNNF